MKKWIVGIFLLALVAGESSCVVRDDRRRHHHHHDEPHSVGVIVH